MFREWSSWVPRVGSESPGIGRDKGNQHTLAVHVDKSLMEVLEAIWESEDGEDKEV